MIGECKASFNIAKVLLHNQNIPFYQRWYEKMSLFIRNMKCGLLEAGWQVGAKIQPIYWRASISEVGILALLNTNLSKVFQFVVYCNSATSDSPFQSAS